MFKSTIDRGKRTVREKLYARELEKQGTLSLVNRVRQKNLTHLGLHKLVQICRTLEEVKRNNIEGIYMEAGCALGGSSIIIGTMRPSEKQVRIYDVFGMIPPPTKEDPSEVFNRYEEIVSGKSSGIKGDTYYGYVEDLQKVVLNNLQENMPPEKMENISLYKGLVQDTLTVEEPVAFAHIDVDWYDPVKVCLDRIAPRVAVGGSIIIDDYSDWGGCRKAVDEFLEHTPNDFEIDPTMGSLKLTKL